MAKPGGFAPSGSRRLPRTSQKRTFASFAVAASHGRASFGNETKETTMKDFTLEPHIAENLAKVASLIGPEDCPPEILDELCKLLGRDTEDEVTREAIALTWATPVIMMAAVLSIQPAVAKIMGFSVESLDDVPHPLAAIVNTTFGAGYAYGRITDSIISEDVDIADPEAFAAFFKGAREEGIEDRAALWRAIRNAAPDAMPHDDDADNGADE